MGVLLTFGTSLLITFIAYRYTIAKGIIDVPNSRSSHTRLTPRGGGISFVVTYSLYLMVSWMQNTVNQNTVVALLGGGMMIAAIGWIDDRHSLSARSRLVVHIAASIWALFWVRPIELDLGILRLSGVVPVYVIGVLMITWVTNLFNFMDGIDGIASMEAITSALTIWMMTQNNSETAVSRLSLALALSVTGFLPMNWHPARIFMGDVGSGYLGFTLSTLAVASQGLGGPPTFVWMVLLGVFVTDATLTLVRRMIQGRSWLEAHRSHVYQLAVQAGHSHRQVTMSVSAINICLGAFCLLTAATRDHRICTLVPFLALSGTHVVLYKRWNQKQVSYSGPRNLDTKPGSCKV